MVASLRSHRLVGRLHSLLELPSPVDDIVRLKQKQIRRADTRPVRQALGLRLKGEVADVLHGKTQALSYRACGVTPGNSQDAPHPPEKPFEFSCRVTRRDIALKFRIWLSIFENCRAR